MKEGVAKYFSEANILNRYGVVAITCGPGNPKLAHVDPKKEIIRILEIEKYSKLLKKIFKNINQHD